MSNFETHPIWRSWPVSGLCAAVGCFMAVVPLWGDELLSRAKVPAGWRANAELRDIYFLDSQRGWAVGDLGTLLQTQDGGATWTECQTLRSVAAEQAKMTSEMRAIVGRAREATGQSDERRMERVPSPISATLETVRFVDSRRGWAAGGYSLPYLDCSRAVVLKTTDGGQTWIPQANQVAPKFNQLRFQSPSRGIAFTQGGHLYRTGFVVSHDGGLNWISPADAGRVSWRTGAMTQAGYIGLDTAGDLRRVEGERMEAAVIRQRPRRPVRDLLMLDEQNGWAVGDQGTVLQTNDGGVSWSVPEGIEPIAALRGFDFQTVAACEERIWFAGNPGTYLFCFDPRRQELSASRSPTGAAINRLTFVGTAGWACGQFGTILATVDQGESWQRQRGEDPSTAVLVINWNDSGEGLEAIARFGADGGLRVAACHIRTGETSPSPELAREAAIRSGALAGVSLTGVSPVTSKSSVNADFSPPDWEAIELGLVRWIRQWRPRVLVSSESLLRSETGPVQDLNEWLHRAVRSAANADYDSQFLNASGLGPWQVDLILLAQRGGGHWPLADNAFLTHSGQLLGDFLAISRALLGRGMIRDSSLGFEVLPCPGGVAVTPHSSLTDSFQRQGIQLARRQEARIEQGNLREVQAAMGKTSQMQQLWAQNVQTQGDQLVWQQAIARFLSSADEETAGSWLAQLAEGYLERGRLQMAELALQQLVERVPQHGLAPAARLWLAQSAVSREFQLAARESSPTESNAETFKQEVRNAAYESQVQRVQQDGVQKLVWVPRPETTSDLQATAAELPATAAPPTTTLKQFWEQAGRHLSRFRQRDPELSELPAARWLEARGLLALTRWPDGPGAAFAELAKDTGLPAAFQKAAQREIEFQNGDPNLRPGISCCPAPVPPRLDGQFDDPVWQNCRDSASHRKLIARANGEPNGELRIAYDNDYLYLAIECQKLPGVAYRDRTGPRRRDERLDDQDRVTLYWDLDQDGYWPLKLSVDSRGCLADGCGMARGWDPEWFCARRLNENSWAVEIAIPWEQFGSARPTAETEWRFGAARFAPWNETNIWTEGPAIGILRNSAPLTVPLEADGMQPLAFAPASSSSSDE